MVSEERSPVAQETVSGYSCTRHALRAVGSDGTTNSVVVWRAGALKDFPIQVQIIESNDVFRVRFNQVTSRPIVPERFEIPASLNKYNSFEDLVQSVLLEKVKKRMGIQ
jgi:hypothetical protein